MKTTTVHLIPAFHYDVAYKKTFSGYLPESLANVKNALKLLDDNEEYTFCVEQVILIREYWETYPEDRSLIAKFAKEGRLYFAPGMFSMPDSNIPSGENFIRNALIGRKWLKENLGVVPDCCWMADIFGHNPQSPQLAKTCGFQSYMFERGKSGSMNTAFQWEGIDGTRINTQWEIDTYYGVGLALSWANIRPEEWLRDRIYKLVVDRQRDNCVSKSDLMSPLGGDFRMPTQGDIDFVKKWNKDDENTKLKFSSPPKFYNVLKKNGIELPIEKIDLNPLMQGAWSSRIRIKQFNRHLEQVAAALELSESINKVSHEASDELWEVLVWNSFHDILAGTLAFDAYKEALEKYENAKNDASRALENTMSDFASETFRKGKSDGTLLFNSLPYPRNEIIQISDNDFQSAYLQASGFTLKPSAKFAGNSIDRNGVVRTGKNSLENDLIKITIGKNGTISSLYDKEHGFEMACPESGMNNPYRQTDYGDLWTIGSGPVNASLLRTAPNRDPKPVTASKLVIEGGVDLRGIDADCQPWPEPVIIHNHPLQGTIEVAYPEMGYSTRISLRSEEKIVRFQTRFIPSGSHYRLRVGFPTSIQKGTIRNSVPCGHIERPEGEYCVQGWSDYADDEKGLLLLNKGIPGSNVSGNVMMLSLFRAIAMEKDGGPEHYEEGEEHVFEYAVMPFSPHDKNYAPARIAEIFNCPTYSKQVSEIDISSWKETDPFIHMEGDNAEMTCCRLEGDTITVRLYESKGESGEISLTFRDIIKKVLRCDATRENEKMESFKGKKVAIKLKPFEIVTLKAEIQA